MRNYIALLAGSALLATVGTLLAQQPGSGSISPTPADIAGNGLGHAVVTGGNVPTTITNVTLADGSSDINGSFVATNTSGSITFGVSYNRPPFCLLTGITATAPTYAVTAQQIVLTTIVNGSTYYYWCLARPGG